MAKIRKLTKEGELLWNNMDNEDFINSIADVNDKNLDTIVGMDSPKKVKMLVELRVLLNNSKIVVADCKEKREYWTKKEQYFKANEARVAETIHSNFVTRLSRILEGGTAFIPEDFMEPEDKTIE